MENYNSNDKEFIEGVWRKVRYLEYSRMEEEEIKIRQKMLFRQSFKLGTIFLIIILSSVVPLLITDNFSLFSIVVSGFILLGSGAAYEYIRDSYIPRRINHEN